MESDVIQRIREVIEARGLSVTALSKLLGVVQQTLNRQISGDGAMSLGTIDKFLSCFPEISAEWLLRGEGGMIKGEGMGDGCACKSFDANIEIDNDGYLKIRIKK